MVNLFSLTLYHTIPTFNDPPKRSLLKTLRGNGENASNQHFLHFPQYLLPFPQQISIISVKFILSSGNDFNLDHLEKFCRLVKR